MIDCPTAGQNPVIDKKGRHLTFNIQAGEGSLTFLEVKDLKNWTYDLTLEDENLLTE